MSCSGHIYFCVRVTGEHMNVEGQWSQIAVCRLNAADHCYMQGVYEIIDTVYSYIYNDPIKAHLCVCYSYCSLWVTHALFWMVKVTDEPGKLHMTLCLHVAGSAGKVAEWDLTNCQEDRYHICNQACSYCTTSWTSGRRHSWSWVVGLCYPCRRKVSLTSIRWLHVFYTWTDIVVWIDAMPVIVSSSWNHHAFIKLCSRHSY